LQRKLAGARQLGTKTLNLGLTTTMNELLISFGVTSAGFGPLASASGSRADVLNQLPHLRSTALPGRWKPWISAALAIPLVGKTIAVTGSDARGSRLSVPI
jgi:hypothetical protein